MTLCSTCTEKLTRYLDDNIEFWRDRAARGDPVADYYVDAYQSVRVSFTGKTLQGGDGRVMDAAEHW